MCDLEEKMEICVPTEDDTAETKRVVVYLKKGRGVFSVQLPWAQIDAIEIVPRRFPGIIDFQKLEFVVPRLLDDTDQLRADR